jgi:hypothetical protein
MPYGDYGDSAVVSTTASSWPGSTRRQGIGLLSLAVATLLSFGAGVGSTFFYIQTFKDETSLAALPLIEADKAPTRVRPEGFDPAPKFAAPSSLPSPISSAMAAVAEPLIDLTPQGIPTAPEIVPPVAAAVIELAPLPSVETINMPASVASVPGEEMARAEPQFRLQLASMRSPEGAYQELSRLKQLHANLLASVDLAVERIDQGGRGVFYRVLSGAVGERPEASEMCSVIAQKRGQCAVIALRPQLPVAEIRPAEPQAPVRALQQSAASVPPRSAAVAPVEAPAPVEPILSTASETPIANASRAESVAGEVRAQLGSLRSMEGASREVARLSRIYGATLGSTELSVSRIDQGERGVFYRILTAPLPSRDAGADLCQRLGNSHQAGCVLIPGRPTA